MLIVVTMATMLNNNVIAPATAFMVSVATHFNAHAATFAVVVPMHFAPFPVTVVAITADANAHVVGAGNGRGRNSNSRQGCKNAS